MIAVVRPAVVCAALLLGACVLETLSGHIYRVGAVHEFAYAAGGRDFKTIIIGNPFSQPKDQVDAAVTGAMQGNHPGPRTHFTTQPNDTAAPGYRITIMFNPPTAVDADDLCGDVSGLSAESASARLRMLAAFCSHGDVMSYVYASNATAVSPSHPTVRRMVANVMYELIPAIDPHMNDNDADFVS